MPSSVRLKSLIQLLLSLRGHLWATLKSPLSLPRDRVNECLLVPCCKGGLSASHSSCFCLLKPHQFVLVLFSSWMQQGLVQSFTSSTIAKEQLATHRALPCSVHPRAKYVLSCCCIQDQADPLIPLRCPSENGMGSMDWPAPSSGSAYCGPRGFCTSILASVLAMNEEKEGPETGSCAGWEEGTAEAGSSAVFGVCSHRSSPVPSECNCGDKVGAA